jgi:hypothetical protein
MEEEMADPTGVLRGHDVSHHQDDIDVGRLSCEFVVARTFQGKGGKYGTTIDGFYRQHKANALRAGMLFSSYAYLGNGISPAENVRLHLSQEPDKNVPVMLDWEEGSGDGPFLKACEDEFTRQGLFVWGKYAPNWYYQKVGHPSLAYGSPLVGSRYKDYLPGTWVSEYQGTPDSYWAAYGGNIVRMLQFSSVVRDTAYPSRNLDGLAFRGTRAELATWWNRNKPNPSPQPGELTAGGEIVKTYEFDTPADEHDHEYEVELSGGPTAAIVVRPRPGGDGQIQPMWVPQILAWGSDDRGIGFDPKYTPGYDAKMRGHRRFELPRAVKATVILSTTGPFTIDVVG